MLIRLFIGRLSQALDEFTRCDGATARRVEFVVHNFPFVFGFVCSRFSDFTPCYRSNGGMVAENLRSFGGREAAERTRKQRRWIDEEGGLPASCPRINQHLTVSPRDKTCGFE